MQHQLEEEEEGIEVEDGQELYPQARPSFAEFVTEQVILPFQLQQPDQPERKKSIYGMLVFPNDDDDDDDDNASSTTSLRMYPYLFAECSWAIVIGCEELM